MLKLLERTKNRLLSFVEQRRNGVLIVHCADNDTAILLKLLREIDEASSEDLFVLLGGNFDNSPAFVESAIKQFEQEYQLASQALVENGKPPLPKFPSELNDLNLLPPQRLRKMVAFGEQLLPQEGSKLIWAIVPSNITDIPAYHELMLALAPPGVIEPWMRRGRLMLREQAVYQKDHPWLTMAKGRVEEVEFDFGPEAVNAGMNEDANDQSLPLEARMQSLLMIALTDSAHGRFEPAAEKLDHLLAYYQQTSNPAMQATVMNSLGDLHSRQQDAEQAQYWYECALVEAEKGKNPIVSATVIKNLGILAHSKKEYAHAEHYFDCLDQIAAKMLDSETKAWALEWRGISQEKQGKMNQALESWENGAQLSRNTDQPHALRSHLQRLQEAYSKVGPLNRAHEIENELKNIPLNDGAAHD